MTIKFAYITKTRFPCGEISVQAHTAMGRLVFGFRTRDAWGWQEKARTWAGTQGYVAAFGSRGPAPVINLRTSP